MTLATPHACQMAEVELSELPGRRCAIAAALELVGERWSLLVVRELLSGATRFGEIVAGTGAPRDRFAARLKSLEQMGIINRTPYQTAPRRFEYRLSDAGYALAPVLDTLRTWGLDHAVTSDDCDRDSWVKREHTEGAQ
jgi:DNA-binding HxlR family transcriptional regulator